jgi:hypothetical protein
MLKLGFYPWYERVIMVDDTLRCNRLETYIEAGTAEINLTSEPVIALICVRHNMPIRYSYQGVVCRMNKTSVKNMVELLFINDGHNLNSLRCIDFTDWCISEHMLASMQSGRFRLRGVMRRLRSS